MHSYSHNQDPLERNCIIDEPNEGWCLWCFMTPSANAHTQGSCLRRFSLMWSASACAQIESNITLHFCEISLLREVARTDLKRISSHIEFFHIVPEAHKISLKLLSQFICLKPAQRGRLIPWKYSWASPCAARGGRKWIIWLRAVRYQ